MDLRCTATRGLSESLISNFQQFCRRTMFGPPRQDDARAVQALDRVHECRTVTLAAQVFTHFYREVRPQTDEAPVESGVMQRAQRQSVMYMRFTARLGIRDDVCRVQ